MPHITSRKIKVSIQDFCNLLGGGLVSLSTLHVDTLKFMANMSSGAVICTYKYHPRDVLVKVVKVEPSSEPSAESSSESSESSSLEIKVDPSTSMKMESSDVENEAAVEREVEETDEKGRKVFIIMNN